MLVGRGANAAYGGGGGRGKGGGCVVKMEHRRISGRGVGEVFWFPPTGGEGKVILLDDHPLFLSSSPSQHHPTSTATTIPTPTDNNETTTFSLSLSDKQRRDREAVVLPYFDAQRSELDERAAGDEGRGGVGEGGRILYQMGVEDMDDFDEEEDEI